MRSANANLNEWKEKGEEITAKMIAKYETKLANKSDATATESESSSGSEDEDELHDHSEVHVPPRFGIHGRKARHGRE